VDFNSILIDIFIEETKTDNPNYPLFRRYFKSGNSRLFQLLITGLTDASTNQTLLSGLGYFHENNQILSKLITIYTNACEKNRILKNSNIFVLIFQLTHNPMGMMRSQP
jgi:hypothetical protein